MYIHIYIDPVYIYPVVKFQLTRSELKAVHLA